MDRLQSTLDRVSVLGAYVAGTLLLAASFLVVAEAVSRKFLGFSFGGADELTGYVYAISMSWSYAYVLNRRGHVRVELLLSYIPKKFHKALDVVSTGSLTIASILLTYWGWISLSQNLETSARSNTPLAIPLSYVQVPWLLGLAFLALSAAVITAQTIMGHDTETEPEAPKTQEELIASNID